MVEQILEFAGIQSGQRGMNLRPVAIAPLLHAVVSASSALIEAAKLRVDFDLAERIPPVLGDEPALRRVFQNLIGNAVKYGQGGESILLRARASGAHVIVHVVDHGIGIAPSEQVRIFEPFYRAADVVAAQIQGAGLGLSLVQRIVEAHRGNVTVTSAPGEGSEFTVTLPAAVSDPHARSTHSAPVPAENAGTTAS
jgi:signal transduction histidine kinase